MMVFQTMQETLGIEKCEHIRCNILELKTEQIIGKLNVTDKRKGRKKYISKFSSLNNLGYDAFF